MSSAPGVAKQGAPVARALCVNTRYTSNVKEQKNTDSGNAKAPSLAAASAACSAVKTPVVSNAIVNTPALSVDKCLRSHVRMAFYH